MQSDRRREEAKARVSIAAAWVALGCPGTPPKDGGSSLSPFRHGDNKSAFGISPCGRLWRDRVTGAGGDVITFIKEAMHCDDAEAFRTLYRIAGMDMREGRAAQKWPRAPLPSLPAAAAPWKQKSPPWDMGPLSLDELNRLRTLRKLGPVVCGLRLMEDRGLLRSGTWSDTTEPGGKVWADVPVFITTDPLEENAMIRRQDGKGWNCIAGDGKPPKSRQWIGREKFAGWPVGAQLLMGELYDARAVIVVEGAPDLWAAHVAAFAHFGGPVVMRGLAIVAMSSASDSVHSEALPLFAGRHVRIIPHMFDTTRAGEKAARKWADQLAPVADSVDFRALSTSRKCDLNDEVSRVFDALPNPCDGIGNPHLFASLFDGLPL